ncbi:MAG: hypothetical protein V4608_10770 [Bacteroidota bacterium]
MNYDNYKLATPDSYFEKEIEIETVICEYCGDHHNKENSTSFSEDWDMMGMVDVWVCDGCVRKYK